MESIEENTISLLQGPDADPDSHVIGGTFSISALAEDDLGLDVTYEWAVLCDTLGTGTLPLGSSGPEIVWISPDNNSPDTVETCTATLTLSAPFAPALDPLPSVDMALLPDDGATADVGIVKTVSNDKPAVGEVVTYTLELTNYGDVDVATALVSEDLEAGLLFVSDSSAGAEYDGAVWTVTDLAAGQTA